MPKYTRWTATKVATEALQHLTIKEFKKAASGAYAYAYRNDMLAKVTSHMAAPFTPAIRRTDEEVLLTAKQYKHVRDLKRHDRGVYDAILTRGLKKQAFSHMIPLKTSWTDKALQEEALKFITKNAFYSFSSAAYQVACKRGILGSVCAHMTTSQTIWTKQLAEAVANKYNVLSEFRTKEPNAYKFIVKEKIIEGVCGHMAKAYPERSIKVDNNITGIYILYKDNVIIYIGKSHSCVHARIKYHLDTKDIDKVEVFEMLNASDIDVIEVYLIALHKPYFNKECNTKGTLTVSLANMNDTINRKIIATSKGVLNEK